MKRKTKTRVTVDFPVEEHKRLKAMAAILGISMQEYIITCVEENLYSENVPNAETLNVFMETDEGKNLKKYKNIDELIKKFGT
jgi:hypothetical protein